MIGLPMLNGFVGEFLILSGTFTGVSRGWATAATITVILGAAYMLWLIQRLFYGPESAMAAVRPVNDLAFHEIATVAPLAILMLVMGVFPNYWLRAIDRTPEPAGMTTPGHDYRIEAGTMRISPAAEAQR